METTQSSHPVSPPKYLQEDHLTQECNDLLPTLPSVEDSFSINFFLYQGFWFRSFMLDGIISCRNRFQARNDDIILATFPKSGTTWLKAIVFALTTRFHYGEKDSPPQPHPLLVKNPHELVPYLEMFPRYDNEGRDSSSLPSRRILATHIPYSLLPQSIGDSECKIIYVCRNPKDTFVSLWHFVSGIVLKEKGGNAIDVVFDQFCQGLCSYGPFWEHYLEYWKAGLDMPSKVLFLKYEEMKERPNEVFRRLAEFIGCPFVEPEDDDAVNEIVRMCSFESLSSLEVNKSGRSGSRVENRLLFRKGEVGDWKNFLSSEMIERIDRITDEKLRESGLKF